MGLCHSTNGTDLVLSIMSKITYQGRRIPNIIVLVFDEETKKSRMLNPSRSRRVYDHSTEFNWSYGGSGPAQLSLALLLDAIKETPVEQRPSAEDADVLAERWHLMFLNDHVSNWGDSTFRVSQAEIASWLRTVVAQAQTKREQYSHEPKFPEPGKP